ncbi:MAG: acyltransferase [Bacteroidota bacterium]
MEQSAQLASLLTDLRTHNTIPLPQFFARLAQRLSRITSSGNYIAEVDGLRFMAIMPVLLQHLSERTQRYSAVDWASPLASDPVAFWASRGTIGVFIFFAISGFILGLPFARHYIQGGKSVPLKSYFWRRVTRLEPPYIFWMTCFFLILLIRGGFNTELFAHWGASLAYIHNIAYADYSVINPVAWSLEIEIQFYILAPLLAWLFFRWQKVWLRRGLMVTGIVGILLVQQSFGWVAVPYKLTILWQLHYFLIGFLVADWYLCAVHQQEEGRGNWGLDLLAIAGIAIMGLTWSTDLPKRMIFSLALLVFMVAGFRGRWFRSFLRLRWIAIIGGMCYTIYLIHLPLMEGLVPFTSRISLGNQFWLNLSLQVLLVLPIVLMVSAAGFLFLEKPCMDKHWPKKLWAWFKGHRLSWKNLKQG